MDFVCKDCGYIGTYDELGSRSEHPVPGEPGEITYSTCPECGSDNISDEVKQCEYCEEYYDPEDCIVPNLCVDLCNFCIKELVSSLLKHFNDEELLKDFYDTLYSLSTQEAYIECNKTFPIITREVVNNADELQLLLAILEMADYDMLIKINKGGK